MKKKRSSWMQSRLRLTLLGGGLLLSLWAAQSYLSHIVPEIPQNQGVAGTEVTEEQAQSALSLFKHAQTIELQALKRRGQLELKLAKVQGDAQVKAWEQKERELRYSFFKEHDRGSDRRTYVQAFLKRREEFRKSIAQEKAQKTAELDQKLSLLQQEQAEKLKQFEEQISQGVYPEDHLWPSGKH